MVVSVGYIVVSASSSGSYWFVVSLGSDRVMVSTGAYGVGVFLDCVFPRVDGFGF